MIIRQACTLPGSEPDGRDNSFLYGVPKRALVDVLLTNSCRSSADSGYFPVTCLYSSHRFQNSAALFVRGCGALVCKNIPLLVRMLPVPLQAIIRLPDALPDLMEVLQPFRADNLQRIPFPCFRNVPPCRGEGYPDPPFPSNP